MSEQGKRQDVLIVHLDMALDQERLAMLSQALGQFAMERLGMECIILEKGMRGEVSRDLSGIVQALEAQTQAINALAESNRQVIDYLIAQEVDEEEGASKPRTYLDGTPQEL